MCRGGILRACRAHSVEDEGINIGIGFAGGADVQLSNVVNMEVPPL